MTCLCHVGDFKPNCPHASFEEIGGYYELQRLIKEAEKRAKHYLGNLE